MSLSESDNSKLQAPLRIYDVFCPAVKDEMQLVKMLCKPFCLILLADISNQARLYFLRSDGRQSLRKSPFLAASAQLYHFRLDEATAGGGKPAFERQYMNQRYIVNKPSHLWVVISLGNIETTCISAAQYNNLQGPMHWPRDSFLLTILALLIMQ